MHYAAIVLELILASKENEEDLASTQCLPHGSIRLCEVGGWGYFVCFAAEQIKKIVS